MYGLALLHFATLLQEVEVDEFFGWDDLWLVQPVHIEPRVGIIKSLSHYDFTFEEGVGWHFTAVKSQPVNICGVLIVSETEQSDAVFLQNGVFRRQVDNATDDPYALLDWQPEFVKVFSLQLSLENLLQYLKLGVEIGRPHLRCKVEEVVLLYFRVLQRFNLDLAAFIV